MTTSELRKLNKANGGHFFDRGNMIANGDTMRSFKIRNDSLHPKDFVWLHRKRDNRSWLFSKETGRLVFSTITVRSA